MGFVRSVDTSAHNLIIEIDEELPERFSLQGRKVHGEREHFGFNPRYERLIVAVHSGSITLQIAGPQSHP